MGIPSANDQTDLGEDIWDDASSLNPILVTAILSQRLLWLQHLPGMAGSREIEECLPGDSASPEDLLTVRFWASEKNHRFLERGFLGGSDCKESACNAGDPGSTPGLGRSPGEGNGHPFQCSCLENSMDRGAWQAIVHGVAKSWIWLSN